MMLFFTGFSRTASEIAVEQIKNIERKEADLHRMRNMVDKALTILKSRGDWQGDFGKLLDESWQIKRCLSSKVTTRVIDDFYDKAKNKGALGGKILGAGGGGFLLIYARPEDQNKIKKALSELLHVPFQFESKGSQIIYKI